MIGVVVTGLGGVGYALVIVVGFVTGAGVGVGIGVGTCVGAPG
jgi:hypothetical protein